jgi:phosphoribosylformylglycinamidine synthase
MKIAVITFPGSNCDQDAVMAAKKISNKVLNIWHKQTSLDNDLDLIIIPGGFSYGDYLRSGAMASISPVMQEVKRLADRGNKIIGICNGFQILTESKLLDGCLIRNKSGKFICQSTKLLVANNQSAFTSGYKQNQIINIPIAHADGNFFASDDVIKKLQDNNLIAFRYVDDYGVASAEANPNGSIFNIAGIFNSKKNVLGLMPHPERAIDNHLGSSDGSALFSALQLAC